ncbi:MAG: hypothetical protein ABJB97_08580, partial [Acidobacteriota bacterium]
LILTNQPARAGSATWKLDPISGDWNTAANWTPATVPNGSSDTATFGASNLTDVSLSNAVQVSEVVFGADTSAFTISASAVTGISRLAGRASSIIPVSRKTLLPQQGLWVAVG